MPYLKEFSLILLESKNINNRPVTNNDVEIIPFDFTNDREIIESLSKGNFDEYAQKLIQIEEPFIPNHQAIQFRQETRCITALYEAFFEKFKTQCWKIEIECINKIFREEPVIVGGVAQVQIHFDKDRYFKSSDDEKKVVALETLYKGINLAVKEFKWELSPFENAYNKVISFDYNNRFIYGKPQYNSKRKLVAEIVCEHKVNVFEIYIIIKNRDGQEIKRELVKTEIPDEFYFRRHLGKLNWTSVNQLELTNQSNTEKWLVEI